MYLSADQTVAFATEHFDALVKYAEHKNLAMTIAPTLPVIRDLALIFKDTQLSWAAQDCSNHLAGAFTGQVSPLSLKEIGCSACIIGHSERRRFCGETSEDVAIKTQLLLDCALSPIICIGEDHEHMEQALATLHEQLNPVLQAIKNYQHKIKNIPVYIAYEPAWSIGTGKIAESSYLESIFAWLKKETQALGAGFTWRFLYGGSVNAQTITAFKKIGAIEGFLIGKASSNFEEFEKILKSIMLES